MKKENEMTVTTKRFFKNVELRRKLRIVEDPTDDKSQISKDTAWLGIVTILPRNENVSLAPPPNFELSELAFESHIANSV